MNYCVLGTVRTYLIKVFQQMLIEHRTHSRHYSRCWEYSSENNNNNNKKTDKTQILELRFYWGEKINKM